MYRLLYVCIDYCPVSVGIKLYTNFAVWRARILLMLVSGRPQCALSLSLCVHRTTTHSLLCSVKHALSLCSVCVLMRPVFFLQYQVLSMKCFPGGL